AAERGLLLEEWNATHRALPCATVVDLFAAQAGRTPDAAAVVFGEERLTYGELDRRSNQLAHHLRSVGGGPRVVGGLWVERSAAMVVGVLGILKAGGAYLPLDPDYPAARLAFMLADAGAPVVVTQSSLLERLPASDARIVCLDTEAGAIASAPARAPAVAPRSPHPPPVISTS